MKSLSIVLLVVATALAVPLPNTQEAWPPVEELTCTNSRFQVNTIYEYKYEAFSFTNVDGTSEKGTGLRYRCDVQASVPEPCKLVVNVDNCALRYLDDIEEQTKLPRHDISKDFDAAVSRYDIIAHVDNGIVERVLAHPDEPNYILNIKKGLLNMISLNFEEGSEELVERRTPCVSGNCTQLRRVVDRRDGYETDVEVTRDLRQCENRPISGLWTSPLMYNVTLWDKAISSNQTCVYELEWDSIKRVKCAEFHTLWPFSYDSTRGIKMEVFQDLKYSGKEKVNSVTPINEDSRRITDLIFEHEEEEEKVNDPTYATEILKKLVKGSLEEIQMETPQLFSQFVGAIRKLNNESIHEMYERAINCPLYYESCQNNEPKVTLIKTFVYDALVQCGSLECFRVINTAIISGEVSKPLADFVMYTMALRDYPELTLIEETLRVAFYNRTQSTFLPLSIMINNYWNRNEQVLKSERQLPEEIHQAVAFMSSIIGYDCSMPSNAIDGGETVEHQRQVYLALKAIGNIGQPALHYDKSHYLVDEMMATRLVKCAQNKDIPRNISLAAVQAMRRFEITTEIRDPLKAILLNADQDVELRLVSYLMIMGSRPDEIVVRDVLYMLREEPIDQVRAFVYSHLDNILESDLDTVKEIKDTILSALRGEDLPEYPKDIRRLSRNIELSKVLNISQFDSIIRYLNETFDSPIFNATIAQLLNVNKTIGGGIEMNTVHNVETYWMRAAMLKTTLNLLGKEWEMVETGIDMQGFEPTFEALFGAQGFFPDNILASIIKTVDEKFIQVLRDLYNTVEPHVMDVYNTPVAEMPDVLSTKAKDTTDYLYDSYNKMNGKQKRSITDSLSERLTELTNLLPGEIHENLQTMHETVSKLPLSPAASVYLRLLGHEVGFVTLDDVVRMVPKVNLTKDGLMQMALKMIEKAKNGIEYNITKSFVFMDKEFVLPTSMGLPVRCNVNGTTSVSLRLRGQAGIQLPKVFVAGRIAPSGAVNFVGAMTTELPGLTKHAVVANATLYHASRFEGNITIDGPHIKVNLNNTTPMNLLNFSTNFYLQDLDGQMTYIPGIQEDRVEKEMCVPESLTQPIFGITPCVSWAYPNASYAEKAPRFPLTGPSSFNVTLRNIDPSLKTFTWEAYYKQVKPSAPKTTMMRRRRSTTEQKVNIIDTVVMKFSAPCNTHKREIISTASFDRSKTEFRYNFSVPEANVTFFSGILNKTCSKSKVSGFQFVTNFTALRPEYNGSVSLTLMNSTVTDKNNYTAVFNMSIKDLYSSAVAEYVHTPTFLIASTNVTYYWDNETPLYRQVMWPINNYTINPTKYRQDYIMVKSEKRETSKNRERDSLLKVSVLNQNFTISSAITKDDVYYHNDVQVDFENSIRNLRIINMTVKSEKRETKQSLKVAAKRFGHGVFVQYDGRQDSTDRNHTLTYGYEADKKEILESFKVFENQPSIMAWFEDDAFSVQHFSYNISHILCLRDESIPNSVSQRLVYFNTSFPKLVTDGRLNFSLSARVANESMRADNNRSYWMEFNTSVPFLWFHNAQRLQFIDGIEGIETRYNNTMTELFTNRSISFDDRFQYLWKTMNATMEMNVKSCYYNYTFNATMYNSTESGYVFDYSSLQNNTLLHLFNITHGGNFSIAPRNISLIGAFWHPWMQVNMTNVLHKHGPITRFSLANIRAISVDVKNKAQLWDFTGVKNVVKELINNTLESSFNLTNLITVRTPWLGNITLDHATHFNFSLINHTMNVEVIRPRSNVGFLLNTSALLNRTSLSGAYNARLIGNRFYNGTSNMSFALRKADEGALAVDFMNNHGFVTPFGKMNMNGTYNIHNMTRPWRFNVINGTLGYEVSSRLVNSTMNSSFIMDNFTHFFKFDGIRADLDHNITSPWTKWLANGSFIIDDFRNPINYTRINGSLTTNFTSCIANMTNNINMDVQNMSGVFRFEKIGGNITQNVSTIFGNSAFNTGVHLKDVTSPWNFTKVKGSMDYNLTSRLANLTMSNMLKFKNFTKLWEFEKIKGHMIWNLNTSLANATLKHGIDFENFVTPINFDRVNVTLEHEVNSKLTNASLKQAYGMYGMRSYLTFERANSSIEGEVRAPWINSSLAHVMDVQAMNGPFNMEFANVSFAARTDNRFLNFTTSNGMEWNNMRGIVTFDRINGSHNLNISSPIGIFNTFGELVLDDFTKITAFRMINATGLVNVTSRFLNFTSRVGHEMHEFRSLFDFNQVRTLERTVLRNCLFNHTGETQLSFNSFRSIFNFDSIIGNLDAKTRTFLGEHNQTYAFDLRNSRQLFDFDRLYANAQIDTQSRWFNMSALHNVDLNTFERLFSFNSASLTSKVDIKTPLINTTHEVRLLDNDHREMFTFNRIFGGHRWTVDTPIHSFVTDSDIELLHFYKMFQFTHLHANNEMELTNRFVNFTNSHKYHMDGFRSATDFDQISTGGVTELTSILGNHNSNIDITFNQFRSLLNFDSIKGLGESHFVSRYLNDSVVLRSGVTNHRALFDYDRFDGSYNMLFHTRWYNLTQNAGFGVDMMRKLFNFDRISTGASINMTTPIMSTGSRAGIEFENFRSLLNYERINTSAAMNLTSKWLNVTSEATHGIHEMRRMFVFERMNTTGILNISTPIITSNTSLSLDMFNFTKLWQFTRVNGSALWNVSSRWLNISNDGMFGLHNVSTPWRFERINGTAKMNVSTPIVNTKGMVAVEFFNFTNLFNFTRVYSGANLNITNRFVNFTTCGEFGLHNFSRIFNFERINGTTRMNLSTPFFVQSGEAGLELIDFNKLWQFRRINGSGIYNISSRFLNVTTGGDFGLHNFDWFTTFERINGSIRMNVSTPILRQASRVGIELVDFTDLTNFRRINATANMTVDSRILNVTSQGEFGVHNMRGLFVFDRINTSAVANVSTPLVNVSVIAGSEYANFLSLFNFERVNYNHTVGIRSKLANFTCEGAIGFHNFDSFSVYRLIEGFERMNFTSKYMNMTTCHAFEDKNHSAFFAFEQFNVTSNFNLTSPFHRFTTNATFDMHNGRFILDFDQVDFNMTTEFITRYINTTTNSSIALRDVRSLFNFDKVNTTFVANITTPVASTKLNASLLFDKVTSWRQHNINGSVVFLFRSPMLNTSALAQINMTDFLTFSQIVQVDNRIRVMEREAGLVLTEKVNNNFVILNVTVPETGSLCALAELNQVGDLLNMSIFRQTSENINITDLSWILMLNRSDVIYSNFTWNPETLRTIRALPVQAFNKTVNVTLIALNKTREAVNRTLTVARHAINSTIQAVNYTYNNPIDSIKIVVNGSLVDATIVRLNATKLFLNQTMNATIFYVNQTWHLMNFTNVNSTVESFVEAIKQTPLRVPISYVNETVRRMDFTSVNSTITSILREINCAKTNRTVLTLIKHLNNSVEILGTKLNETLVLLNTTSTKAIIYFNQKLNETIVFLNETWRDGNFTTLNATIDTLISALNRTRLNNTILLINNTWQQMNFTNLNSTVESLKKVVNFTAINATVQRLIERVNFTQINETVFEMLKMVNLTHLNETVMNYTNLVIREIQRIAMNESHPINQFTIRYLNTTAYNVTMKLHPIVLNATEKYYPIVRNFTMHYYKIGQNLTEKYYPVVYNFTVTYYPHVVNYTLVAYNKTKNFTCVAMNLTRVYGEVLYNRSLIIFNQTANYTDRALNLTRHYGLVAFNKTRNYTCWFINVTRPHRELAYNYTLNMTNLALNKAVNYSLQVIEYTANKTEWAKENHREYIIYYIEVLNNMTHKARNISSGVFNVTEQALRKALNITIKYGKPLAVKALEMSKNPRCRVNHLPMQYFEKTLYELANELRENITRKALEIVLKEDSTLNVYLEKITDMNTVEFGMFVRAKAIEYNHYIRGNVTYFANVTHSNVTCWANYTLENAPMIALNLIGNATIKANDTILWLNSTRSQSLNATLEQVKTYLNETVVEVVEFLNKTLNGSTERLLNMTWAGYNMTLVYANRTLIYVNETACYVRNTTVRVWRFINDETPLVNMTLEFANKTLNFTLVYANKTLELTLEYAQKGKNASLIAFDYLKNKTQAAKNYTEATLRNMDLEYIYFIANFTKNVTQWSLDYSKDTARLGVEYVNGTMLGWFIRYYEIHHIPYNLYNITYTHVNNTPEYLRQMVEFNKRLSIDALNTIGRLEDNSFAINISHPLNITSFRKFPNLTNDQWEMIHNVSERVKIYACKAREYVDVLREIAEEKYTIAKEYVTEIYEREKPRIDEKINQLKAKYEELKVKVQELRERIPEFRQQAIEKYETLKANWPEYKQQLKEKIQEIKEQIPSWDEIKEIPNQIKEEIDAIIARWPETYVEIRSQIIALPGKYLELKSKINAWIEQLEFDIPMACQKMMDKTEEYPMVNDGITRMCNKIPELRLEAEEKLEEVQRYIEIAKVYTEQKLEILCEQRPTECEQVIQYWQTISEIDAPYVTQKLEEYIPETWDDAKLKANEKWEILRQKIEELKAEAEVKIEELKVKVEELKAKAIEKREELKEKIIEIRDLIKQEYPNAKEHIRNAVEQVKNMIEGTYNEIRKMLVDFIEANYPTLKMYVEEIVNDILAYIMGLQPVMDKHASAMIFGNLGVLTFDKKLYEFPGYRDESCTYVLARDFVDRNFTLLADKKSITAVLPTVVVKIDDEHKVYIDGVPELQDLPYQTPDRNIQVIRDGPWINVTTKYGITLNCHEHHFLCTVKLSSFYHGKTQGLLGTFDREIDNEMRKTDNTNATSIVEWINNYEVTGHSYCQIPPGRNVLPTISGVCDEPAAQKISTCEQLFIDQQSAFAEAFNVIDNRPFFELCNYMARDCRDICEVAHGYVAVSRDEGIMIDHSPMCDRCEDIELDTKFNVTKIAENTADIAIIVSEHQDNTASPRYIKDLVAKLDKTLGKAGIENNRYTLIAFGGEGVHSEPHLHTSRSRVFVTKDDLSYGIDELEFNGEHQTDAIGALEYANNLHWRKEASRIMILITEAEREEPYNTTRTYQDMTTLLEDNSVRLFIFSEYDTLNKDGIEPVLGINYDSTVVTIKKTSADSSFKLKLPKGNYAKIATASKGAMFRINMLMSNTIDRSEFNAQISKVLRNSIESEFETTNYKECKCALDLHQCPITECKTIRK